ncbi:MAG: hypothetical protein V9G10_03195 [Candidatus Nanopelagicales bacterium]
MTAQLAIDDRAFNSYLAVVTGDAEDALSGIENTFASSAATGSQEDVVTREELLDLLSRSPGRRGCRAHRDRIR